MSTYTNKFQSKVFHCNPCEINPEKASKNQKNDFWGSMSNLKAIIVKMIKNFDNF
jgi:hypothetical protein